MTPPRRRIIVLRANRDTLVLIACTVGVTLAFASVHRQRTEPAPAALAEPSPQQVWAGQLSEVAAVEAVPPKPEPMTSESLVVPKATLALPPVQPAARGTARTACEAAPCAGKATAAPGRQKLAMVEPASPAKGALRTAGAADRKREQRFQLSDLNPLHHLPDAVRKPFTYAGAKVSSWIDWF